jgi:GxxExxY protein
LAELLYKELTFAVIGAAMEVHRILGSGFLESVYQAALERELTLRGIPFAHKVKLPVTYKDLEVGIYEADLIIDGNPRLEQRLVGSSLSCWRQDRFTHRRSGGTTLVGDTSQSTSSNSPHPRSRFNRTKHASSPIHSTSHPTFIFCRHQIKRSAIATKLSASAQATTTSPPISPRSKPPSTKTPRSSRSRMSFQKRIHVRHAAHHRTRP